MSAGRNCSGRITAFHRGGGSKRLQRIIDLKRSSSSMGIVERIEYDPNRSSRIAQVRWSKGIRIRNKRSPFEFAPYYHKHGREETTSTSHKTELSGAIIRGPFAFSSWSKSRFTSNDVFFPPKVFKGETASSLSLGKSFGFPRIAVVGAKPTFFVLRTKEKEVRGENTFSLGDIREWRSNSILWAHRIKRKAALSWGRILGLVGAAEHKPKADRGFYAKTMDEDRAPVTYIIASHQLEAGKMVMNCHWSKPSTANTY